MVRFTRQQEQSLVAAAFMVAVAVFIWVMLFAAAIDVGGLATGASEFAVEYELVTHIVQPGETLWGIAQRYRPNEDPRKVVYEIQEASGIEGGLIMAYQLVLVPIPGEGGV